MSHSARRSSGWFTVSAAVLLALLLAGSVQTPANTASLPPGAIAPTDTQRATARKIGRILEEAHYSRAPLDRKMSELVFQRYLEMLDPQHNYLLQSDVDEFSAYRDQFDDMIRTGDIDPAFVMFFRFQQRNRERMQYALSLLNTEPDWTLDESYDFDREHAPWPTSTAETSTTCGESASRTTRCRCMLTGKTWPEAVDILRKRYERVLKRIDQISPEDVFEASDELLLRVPTTRTPVISRRAAPRNTASR